MGSVSEYIECPRCKNESCFSDYYYKSGEEYNFCSDCGYIHNITFKVAEDGKYILDDKGERIVEEVELKEPYGAYMITFQNGTGQMGAIANDVEYKAIEVRVDDLTKALDNKITKVEISRLIDGKIIKNILYGTAKR